MSYFKRYIALPEEKYSTLKDGKILDRQLLENFATVVLLLAKVNGYNEYFEIRNSDGSFIPNTNVIDYIAELFSVEKEVHKLEEFLHLLIDARVPLSIITNERIKHQMENLVIAKTPPSTLPNINLEESLNDSLNSRNESIENVSRDNQEHTNKVQSINDWKYYDFFVPQKRKLKRKSAKSQQKWKKI